MLSNSQSLFKILFDLPSLGKQAEIGQDNLNLKTCIFGNRDWKEWCQIIHEDCDWKKNEQPDLDIIYEGIIIHNCRKWRAIVQQKISMASPDERSTNMLTIDFAIENTSK